MKTRRITLAQLPYNQPLEGYIWWSDSPTPIVLHSKTLTDIQIDTTQINPFIIEANLWDSEHHISYQIQTLDGTTTVLEIIVASTDITEEHLYYPHKMSSVGRLKFLQVWEPKIDPLCEGFEVLQPTCQPFVGFTK